MFTIHYLFVAVASLAIGSHATGTVFLIGDMGVLIDGDGSATINSEDRNFDQSFDLIIPFFDTQPQVSVCSWRVLTNNGRLQSADNCVSAGCRVRRLPPK